ncbi:MAG: hypothetical protein AAGK32_06625 [Actinomycetota bacterium]
MTIDAHDEQRYARHRVLEATEDLSFEQLQALWLVDVCNYNYRSAAQSTCTSIPELTRQLHRARTSIRRRLDLPQIR